MKIETKKKQNLTNDIFVHVAVEECHGGVMLCVDVTHRVLRQTAVIEILQHAFRNARGNMEDFQKKCEQALIGAMVLTR